MYRLEKARSLAMGMFANGRREHVDEMQSGHPEADAAFAALRTFLEQAKRFQFALRLRIEDYAGAGKASGAVEVAPNRAQGRLRKGRRASDAIRRTG